MPKVLPEYKSQAKARIAEAGLRIFLKKGYRRTTMDDIAREIGVSKGDLYLYFAGKADLLKEIQLAGRRETRRQIAVALDRGDPVDALIGILDETVAQMHEPKVWSMWFDLMAEAVSDPALHETIQVDHREDVRLLKTVLKDGRLASVRVGRANLDDVALAILILFHGTVAQLSFGVPWPKARKALREGLRALLGR